MQDKNSAVYSLQSPNIVYQHGVCMLTVCTQMSFRHSFSMLKGTWRIQLKFPVVILVGYFHFKTK